MQTNERPAGPPPQHELPTSLVQRNCSARNLPLVEFLACVVEDKQAIYISTPISTGPRYLQWLQRRKGHPTAEDTTMEQEVLQPNIAHGRELARQIRDRLSGTVVIDPSAADLPGWEQGEYHELWSHVIQRYASAVVFGNGWEYSSGCAYEFLTAFRCRLEATDEAGQAITVRQGCQRIRAAIAEYRAIGIEPELLAAVLDELAQDCRLEAVQ